MKLLKRLRLLTAVLGVAAASAVIGTTVFGDARGTKPGRADAPPAAAAAKAADDLGKNPFADRPTLTYRAKDGPAVFAWQVKPALPPAPARDRDILVMVDTSASQAGEPLKRARHIIDAVAAAAGANDKIDVWTVNLDHKDATRSLTGGFVAPAADAVKGAAAKLVETEYAAGATDLKAGLEKAAAAFAPNPARQQVILYLGDGESNAGAEPLTEALRTKIGAALEQKDIAFYAVPLGLKVNPHNLHGFAALTGGAVVRLTDDVTAAHGRGEFAAKLKAAFAVPVLKADAVAFGPEVAETFPTKLPPLRADRATLVVGTLKADAANVTATLTGKLAGGPRHTVALVEALPASDTENYFLHAMVRQWKDAPTQDAPAVLAADRALALASQQFRLFREEFLSQAVYAISAGGLDHAEKLYDAAKKIDPTNREAAAGMQVLARMRAGHLDKNGLKLKVEENAKLAREKIAAFAVQEPAKPADAPKAAAADGGANRLQVAQAERAVLEGQYRVLVDDTVRKARQLLATDPDSAYEDLKRQREVVLSNTQLGDGVRAKLASDLEAMMQTVATQGSQIKKNAAAERERIARVRLRRNEYEREQVGEEQTRARIDAFKQLMNQARFELAQQEAQVMIQERVSRGQRIVPEALASYMIGQTATNLREHRELVRIREDRFLLTMMQSEKSFIPYPDEPPVHFPPAAVWRELTSNRIERYASGSLGVDVPPSMRRIQSTIDGPTAQRVKIEAELDSLPLRDIVSQLEKEHDLKIIVLEEAFKAAGEAAIMDKKPNIKQRLTGLTVGSFLEIVLQSVGATYVVRPEYIEITTIDNRLSEKVVRAFDVTELVYQIPQSVNQATLYQNLQLQGQSLAVFGQATFAGGFGAVGGLGLGGFAALGGALGAGGLGAGGGGQGMGGQNIQGQGPGNQLGIGGGVSGFGGGAAGQFGNLGGQFGIQGNDLPSYRILTTLIQEVVARGEWADLNNQFRLNPGQANQNDTEIPKVLPENQLNSLGYYPPARALIIRATGKYHPNSSVKLKKPEGMGAGGPGNPARGNDRVANAGNGAGNPVPPPNNVVAMADEKPRVRNPIEDPRELMKGIDKTNMLRMWQQAMERAEVKDPGMVVACADFLLENEAYGHAAEVLKAGIRTGVTNDAWTHDSLALALKLHKASAVEVERAAMSAVDLDPADAGAYLKAAKTANEYDHPDLALTFCKRAAALEPNRPTAYENALAYAEKAGDARTGDILWATDNLLRRDWTTDGIDHHAETKARLARIVGKFEKDGQAAAVGQVKKTLEQERTRDLVVELLWQGAADLDLAVTEPSGTECSATAKRTAGGGVLKGDSLEQGTDKSEVYTAAQAFGGTYTVSVKSALGKAIGNKATVQVTKFKGTASEQYEVFTVDLANPKPITFSLDGGSRTELASVPTTDYAVAAGTAEMANRAPTGFSGGTGSATGVLGGNGNGITAMPALVPGLDTKIPAMAPGAAGMRATANVGADRKTVHVSAAPVFTGKASDIAVPKVSLLPGSDDR